MLLQITLISLCISGTLTLTDITLNNCPSQFDFATANQTTPGAVSLSKFFYSAFTSDYDVDKVQTIILTGDTQALLPYMQQLMVPYIIIGAIVFFIFIMTIFYCLFDKNWPPCQSIRRNPIEQPYSKKQKRCMIAWIVILGIGISVAGGISFSTIPAMRNYIGYTKCSIYSALDNSLNGDTDNGWGGFQELKFKIGNISSLLDSATTQISTYFTNDDWLVDDLTIMKKKNNEIYTQNEDSTYITPNPATTETNLNAGFDFPRIDSLFIQNDLGPSDTIGTMANDILRGLQTTQIKSYQAYKIYQSAQTLVQSSSTIQTNSVAAQNTLSMYIRQFQVLQTQMDTFSIQFFDNYFSYGLYLQQAVIGFILTGSLLILVGGLSTHCCQIFECRYIVHCGWCFYGLMYTGILVLAFITLSMGSVGYNFCVYFNSALTQESEYTRIGDNYSQNIFNRLDVCLFQDGDALKKFDIDDEMKTVTELFTNIATYYDYDNPSSTNYVDLDISTGKLTGWISAIQKYRDGVFVDSNPEETTNDNPNYAIQQLNLYSNTGGGVSTCSKDKWVFDSTNCTDPNEDTYVATAFQSNGMELSNDTVICISFNQKFTTAMTTSWTQSDFTKRYVQIREDCSDAYEKIIYYGMTLINYRDSRTNLFQGIEDDLTQIFDLNSDFNDVMDSYRTRVDQFYGSVATLNDIVTNQIDGLLVTSDCRALADSIKFTYNSFCVNFMGEVVKVGICSLVLLITSFAAMIVGSVFGVRYANVQKLKRITGEHEQLEDTSSQRKIQLQKDIIVSQRSDSSDNDDNK